MRVKIALLKGGRERGGGRGEKKRPAPFKHISSGRTKVYRVKWFKCSPSHPVPRWF